MFGLKDAEIVARVAEAGGFRAAAAGLGVAPSAVSARVAQIERALGVQLFDRSRRGARPTPAGRRFLEQSARLVALRDEIVSDLSGSGDLRGSLRIGVAETIVHTSAPAALRQVAAWAPRLRIELSVDLSERLARALLEDEIDVAVLLRQWTPRGAVARAYEDVAIDWYADAEAANRFGLATGRADLETLSRLPVITFSKTTPPAQEVERILSTPKVGAPLIHGASSLATIAHLIRSGFGVGTLPDAIAADDVAAGRLLRLDFGPEARLSPLRFDVAHMSPTFDAVVEAFA